MKTCNCCGKRLYLKDRNKAYRKETAYMGILGTFDCPHCRAILGECYLGESYQICLPQFSQEEAPEDRWTYFDLKTLGSKGIGRRHGWFDNKTHLLLQAG